MRSERFAGFANRFHQRVTEFFVTEMLAHSVNESLPKLLAALFMDRFVAHDGEFVRAGRHENENRIALRRFVHAKSVKSLCGWAQWIDIQLAALDENADLARCFRFRVANRFYDFIV